MDGTGDAASLRPGLYLVGTPIGTLDDITLRAVHVLRSATLIAAEDTRRARKLLSHFDIHVPLVSYREENHARMAAHLLESMRGGGAVALVSDAGMPCVSDPGALLVPACEAAGFHVEVIPGPSAVTTAIARAGIGSGFSFLGFPPARTKSRRELFARWSASPLPLVLYEAPHRIAACLQDIVEILGERGVVACRELTKMHEEILRGSAAAVRENLLARPAIKGEFTLIILPAPDDTPEADAVADIASRYAALLADGAAPSAALRALAAETGMKKRELYQALRIKNS